MRQTSTLTAAALVLAIAAQSWANFLPVNSNSKVEYGIEYYIETDKAVYDLGEHIEFLYKVTNVRDETVGIWCSQSPELNVEIQNSEGATIWLLFPLGLPYSRGVRLAPSESRVLSGYSWEMTDYEGYPIEPADYLERGNYRVVGIMYNYRWNEIHQSNWLPTEIGLEIMIIPEPGTALLLSLGSLGLLRRRKVNGQPTNPTEA